MAESETVKVVSLRNNPDLLEETAIFLNKEWPLSLTARLHYLTENKEDFPCSLILLQTADQQNLSRVIGHSRLNKVLGKPTSVFLSCVLIEKAKRGHGFGKKLMAFTEAHASQLGCTAIYLSTTNNCKFYEHLGYQFCSQVSPVKTSSSVFTSSQLAILHGQSEEQKPKQQQDNESTSNSNNYKIKNFREKNNHLLDDHQSRQKISNPCQCGVNSIVNHSNKHQNICHDDSISLSSALLEETVSPSALPLPPPPPPPTPPIPHHLLQTPSQQRTVLAVSLWMRKEI